jgi:hypothetical protein
MAQLKHVYKFGFVILIGAAVFLLDYYELANILYSEIILFCISLLKSGYFIYFAFDRIKNTAHKDFYYHEFLSFVASSVILIIISYAADYYCLFRISEVAFSGVPLRESIIREFINFFYYSISVFTTAGFGDIKPNSTTAQILVSTELMIAFFFTILFIANISHIRESYKQKM